MKLCILGGGLTGLSLAKSLVKKGLSIGLILCVSFIKVSISDTLDLSAFNDKLEQANGLDSIVAGSPEAVFLESLNSISSGLSGKKLTPEEIENALTLIESTDLIEEGFQRKHRLNSKRIFSLVQIYL